MPVLNEPRLFSNIDTANFLALTVGMTCEALDVEKHDVASRTAVAARVADLVRSGMRDAMAIRNRVVAELHALSKIEQTSALCTTASPKTASTRRDSRQTAS